MTQYPFCLCQRSGDDDAKKTTKKNTKCYACAFPCRAFASVCPHLRLHSFRGGVRRIKERVFAYAACCLKEREQSKKDVRGGQRERGQILHCGVGGRKGSSELGSGWKLTEKDFRLVPCGDKSPKIPPCIQPENGRDETTCRAQGAFFSLFCLFFFFTRLEKEVCFSEIPPEICGQRN